MTPRPTLHTPHSTLHTSHFTLKESVQSLTRNFIHTITSTLALTSAPESHPKPDGEAYVVVSPPHTVEPHRVPLTFKAGVVGATSPRQPLPQMAARDSPSL